MIPALLGISLIVLLTVGAVLLWTQAYRAPENVSIRILALTITLLVVAIVLQAARVPVLVYNVVYVVNQAVQISFFVSVLRGRAGLPRIRGELAAAVLVCVAGAVIWVVAPPGVRAVITESGVAGDRVEVLLFGVVITTYLCYASGSIGYWVARLLPVVRRRVLRFSLVVIAVGALCQVVGGLLQIAVLVDRFVAGPQDLPAWSGAPTDTLVVLGFLALLIGAIVPIVDGAIREIPRAVAQRRATRTLEPLWRALHAEFPELALELRSPGPGRTLYRRVVEIRDGLVLLSPYFDERTARRAQDRSVAAGEDADERTVAVQAALVADALASRRQGSAPPAQVARLPDVEPGPVQATAPVGSWEDDAAVLVRLSRRFATHTS